MTTLENILMISELHKSFESHFSVFCERKFRKVLPEDSHLGAALSNTGRHSLKITYLKEDRDFNAAI